MSNVDNWLNVVKKYNQLKTSTSNEVETWTEHNILLNLLDPNKAAMINIRYVIHIPQNIQYLL